MEEIILTSHDLSLMTFEGVEEKSMKKKRGKKLNCFKKVLQKVLTSSIWLIDHWLNNSTSSINKPVNREKYRNISKTFNKQQNNMMWNINIYYEIYSLNVGVNISITRKFRLIRLAADSLAVDNCQNLAKCCRMLQGSIKNQNKVVFYNCFSAIVSFHLMTDNDMFPATYPPLNPDIRLLTHNVRMNAQNRKRYTDTGTLRLRWVIGSDGRLCLCLVRDINKTNKHGEKEMKT